MSQSRVVPDPVDIGQVAAPPYVRLPDLVSVFPTRAARFEALAAGGGPMKDYLAFLGRVARAQAAALKALPPGALPGGADIEFLREHKLPLVDRLAWAPDASWRAALDGVIAGLREAAIPAASRHALEKLAGLDAGARDALASRTLRFETAPEEAAMACFVNAALQVYWTRMAALLDPDMPKMLANPCQCPVCGSAPIASVVHHAGALHGVRFLQCSLCGTQWHHVRIKCAHCDSTKGIAYYGVEGDGGALKAETCTECGTYTKILYYEKNPEQDPFADDIASFGLDVLVEQEEWRRAAPNPFLIPLAPAA